MDARGQNGMRTLLESGLAVASVDFARQRTESFIILHGELRLAHTLLGINQ
jgi:hypothetical protein